ncbi:alpha/beta hydrolase family protein [Dysgonomonas sp. 511]|uniref:alpha/beta hydrolase n=1 Tax=Dysgonomonas sp. 511 TaxID=2302930 RepID=UPI0013D18597|nr:alpha/beta hydrolase-fold protein [Dysgonomonas sp. 511]NDV78666.1 esterase family protein [Dysgonomonas sp. 511]
MKKQVCTLFFLIASCLISLQAQKVDTVEVFSQKMNKALKNVVILPEGYDKANDKRYPVVYLLHGYGGKHSTWVDHTKKSLPQDASKWDVIIVCPDGQNSWYWDSPVNPGMQFETYVSKELIGFVDENYNTIASPKGRAVTGFSMGGHGGLWLGINHPDVFGACGSMSGGVDIRPFPNNWEMRKWLGSYKANPEVWKQYTVATQLHKIEPNTLEIIIDCGKDDFFYKVNEDLHHDMLRRNITHDYIVRPGGHTHKYWNNAVDYQLMFFSKFFNKEPAE